MLDRWSVRQVMAAIVVACLGLLAFGLYLQHVVGLEPCPMCIVQRYTMVLIAVLAALGAALSGRRIHLALSGVLVLLAVFGASLPRARVGCSGTRPRSPPAGAISTA